MKAPMFGKKRVVLTAALAGLSLSSSRALAPRPVSALRHFLRMNMVPKVLLSTLAASDDRKLGRLMGDKRVWAVADQILPISF